MNINLRQNLLTYISFCLPYKHFSYDICLSDFIVSNIKCNITTLRKEFSNLKREGFIEFKYYYRKPYPVLTQRGKLEIKTRLPFKEYDHDGVWKVVIFDIPDNEKMARLKFQKHLVELGFGKLSRGVYISPHPLFTAVKRLARKLGIENNITLIKTSFIENEKHKIASAWNLKEINAEYEKFIQIAKQESLKRMPFWPLSAKQLEKVFAELYSKDPHLPKEILPASWHGKEAYGVFKAISNSY